MIKMSSLEFIKKYCNFKIMPWQKTFLETKFAKGGIVKAPPPHIVGAHSDGYILRHAPGEILVPLTKKKPKRIQRKRTAGWRMPEGVIYVGRPSKFSNPFKVGDQVFNRPQGINHKQAVGLFRTYLMLNEELTEDIKKELRGKDLACWCPLDKPCHGDVLIEIANEPVVINITNKGIDHG